MSTNKIVKTLIIILLVISLIYSMMAFILWEWNPKKMNECDRGMIVFISIFTIIPTVMSYIWDTDKKGNNKYK